MAAVTDSVQTLGSGAAALDVSRIGFGCMGITAFYGKPMADDDAVALLQGVSDAGVTHFDTAEVYKATDGSGLYNETHIGLFLKEVKPRGSFTVATKYLGAVHGGKYDRETVEAAVDASLSRLGLEHIDLYYLHRMPGTLEELLEWMRAMKGIVTGTKKVRCIGLSEVRPDWLRAAHAIHPITAVQQEWSLFTRHLEKELVPTCAELGVSVVAYSPLARNLLAGNTEAPSAGDWRVGNVPRFDADNLKANVALVDKIKAMGEAKGGKSSAQLSLAWLYARAAQLGVTVLPIPGTTKLAHALDNIAASKVELSDAEVEALGKLGEEVAGDRGNESYRKNAYEL
jgi:aryl-alcohol dehydrogenase-like predicted oxidoreductase